MALVVLKLRPLRKGHWSAGAHVLKAQVRPQVWFPKCLRNYKLCPAELGDLKLAYPYIIR